MSLNNFENKIDKLDEINNQINNEHNNQINSENALMQFILKNQEEINNEIDSKSISNNSACFTDSEENSISEHKNIEHEINKLKIDNSYLISQNDFLLKELNLSKQTTLALKNIILQKETYLNKLNIL